MRRPGDLNAGKRKSRRKHGRELTTYNATLQIATALALSGDDIFRVRRVLDQVLPEGADPAGEALAARLVQGAEVLAKQGQVLVGGSPFWTWKRWALQIRGTETR